LIYIAPCLHIDDITMVHWTELN